MMAARGKAARTAASPAALLAPYWLGLAGSAPMAETCTMRAHASAPWSGRAMRLRPLGLETVEVARPAFRQDADQVHDQRCALDRPLHRRLVGEVGKQRHDLADASAIGRRNMAPSGSVTGDAG